ncbi:hypothetical protein NUW54_g11045 [Trametes sanguinea]|uniref:Uncharacterized protein n=1 Tax=Trametes sanguinea TaxID=158606 RepID=A0ACC1NLD2_9APHY|nr:hypothetical protein NUW54_g11045 [Trametes sanguinea]
MYTVLQGFTYVVSRDVFFRGVYAFLVHSGPIVSPSPPPPTLEYTTICRCSEVDDRRTLENVHQLIAADDRSCGDAASPVVTCPPAPHSCFRLLRSRHSDQPTPGGRKATSRTPISQLHWTSSPILRNDVHDEGDDIGSLPSIPNTANFASLPVISCQVCYMAPNLRCKRCKSAYYYSAQHAKDVSHVYRLTYAMSMSRFVRGRTANATNGSVRYSPQAWPSAFGESGTVSYVRQATPHRRCCVQAGVPTGDPQHPLPSSRLAAFHCNATPSPTTIHPDGFLTGKPLGYSSTLVYNDNFVAENKPVRRHYRLG